VGCALRPGVAVRLYGNWPETLCIRGPRTRSSLHIFLRGCSRERLVGRFRPGPAGNAVGESGSQIFLSRPALLADSLLVHQRRPRRAFHTGGHSAFGAKRVVSKGPPNCQRRDRPNAPVCAPNAEEHGRYSGAPAHHERCHLGVGHGGEPDDSWDNRAGTSGNIYGKHDFGGLASANPPTRSYRGSGQSQRSLARRARGVAMRIQKTPSWRGIGKYL